MTSKVASHAEFSYLAINKPVMTIKRTSYVIASLRGKRGNPKQSLWIASSLRLSQ